MGVYNFVLLLLALVTIPIYQHYKGRETFIKSLLRYMSVKEITRFVKRLRRVLEIFKFEPTASTRLALAE